jgi:hypothetical protein
MREIRPSGSVRGVRRNPYPYRDTPKTAAVGSVARRWIAPLLFTGANASKPPRRTACAGSLMWLG